MTVQDDVLAILLKEKTSILSGQNLADELKVSRNAVWKAVKNLNDKGYIIDSISRKGYHLKEITQNLDQTLIKEKLNDKWKDLNIITEHSVSSTNDLVKQHLIEDPGKKVLIASKTQTQGRGRRGKSFYSKLDNGLYFSLGFQPAAENISSLPLYTVLTASVLVKTLEKYVKNSLKIKWVNDIFFKNRKISGILSEVTSDLESGGINSVIIGVGLNLSGSFIKAGPELEEIAGSLFGESTPTEFNQNIFLAEFLNLFSIYEEQFKQKTFLTVYKEHLLGLNQEITYLYKNKKLKGIIRGIDQDAHLIIEQPNGELKTLIGQEISFTSRQFVKKEDDQ